MTDAIGKTENRGAGGRDGANAWTRAITPEITAEALGQLRANGLDGWISVFALGYAAGEAAQHPLALTVDEAELVKYWDLHCDSDPDPHAMSALRAKIRNFLQGETTLPPKKG